MSIAMPDMFSKLDRILDHLRRLDRPVPDLLQPALSAPKIEGLESKLPFRLTEELDTIYQWRDGTKVKAGDLLDDIHFFPGFYFLSLEDAIEVYHEMEDAPQWHKGWFPLFANDGGDFYVIPCQPKKLRSSVVIGFLHGEPEQTAEYETLERMIDTIEECYRDGAFFVDDDDTLEIDDDQHREIAHRLNPTISEWQS